MYPGFQTFSRPTIDCRSSGDIEEIFVEYFVDAGADDAN